MARPSQQFRQTGKSPKRGFPQSQQLTRPFSSPTARQLERTGKPATFFPLSPRSLFPPFWHRPPPSIDRRYQWCGADNDARCVRAETRDDRVWQVTGRRIFSVPWGGGNMDRGGRWVAKQVRVRRLHSFSGGVMTDEARSVRVRGGLQCGTTVVGAIG